MPDKTTISSENIKKDTYCPHGFCKGIQNCDNFYPINGSGLCVFSPIISSTTKIKIYEEHIEKCLYAGLYGQALYWRKKIQQINTEERLTKDGCDLAADLFDGRYGVDG